MKRLFIAAIALLIFTGAVWAEMPQYTELAKNLVDLSGWNAQEPTGMNMAGPGGDMVMAAREYENSGKKITAQILTGGTAQGAWAPFMGGYAIDTPEQLFKTVQSSAYQVGISHSKMEDTGSIIVPLKTGDKVAMFILTYEGMSYEESLELAKRFSWKEIEKAFK